MNKKITAFFLAVILAIFSMVMVSAEGQVNFSVKAVIPDNQINKDSSYFDLHMEPEQEQTLEVRVFNNDKQPIKVKVAVNAAATGRNGLIVYTGGITRDASLKTALCDITKVEQCEYLVPSGGSVPVHVTVKMPEDSFDGIILGGIVITKTGEQSDQPNEQIQIKNDYQYVIGVQLSETETTVKPELHLKYIKPTLVNYHTSLAVNLQNSEAAIVSKLKISAEIYKSGNSKIYRKTEKENISMAPNSNFDFCIDWQNKKFEPGKYRLHMTAQNEQGFWEWDEEFEITAKDADDANQSAVDIEPDSFPQLIVIILAAVILILLIVIIILLIKRRRRPKPCHRRP